MGRGRWGREWGGRDYRIDASVRALALVLRSTK